MVIKQWYVLLLSGLVSLLHAMQQNPLIYHIKQYCEKHDKTSFIEIQHLIAQQKWVNYADNKQDNITPLQHAALYDLSDITALLLTAQADVHSVNTRGMTALHYAALLADPTIMQQLINAGARVHVMSENRDTPLHFAASCSSPAGIELLLTCGALINAQNTAGKTPLHEATMLRDTLRAQALIANGADPAIAQHDGTLPINHALEKKHYDTVALLLSAGSPLVPQLPEALIKMFPYGSPIPDIILGKNTHLNRHAELYLKDHFGIPPFVYAAALGNKHIVKQLLHYGVDPWLKTPYKKDAAEIVNMILTRRPQLSKEQHTVYKRIYNLCHIQLSAFYVLSQQKDMYMSLLPQPLVQHIMHYAARRPIDLQTISPLTEHSIQGHDDIVITIAGSPQNNTMLSINTQKVIIMGLLMTGIAALIYVFYQQAASGKKYLHVVQDHPHVQCCFRAYNELPLLLDDYGCYLSI